MKPQIEKLFKIRDRAIAKGDKGLPLSTQSGEIPKSGSEGYVEVDKLISSVLYVHHDEKDSALWIALVQEDYFLKGRFSHRGYLLYKLAEKDNQLLISEIVW